MKPGSDKILEDKKRKLFNYIKGWGIEIKPVPFLYVFAVEQDPKEGISIAPFNLNFAIHYLNKIIYYSEETPLTLYNLSTFIHEAAHLVASSESPSDTEEDSILAFELELAKKLNIYKYYINDFLTGYVQLDNKIYYRFGDLDHKNK